MFIAVVAPIAGCSGDDLVLPPDGTATIPAAIDKFQGDSQTGVVGSELPKEVVVKLVDQESNPVSGVQVSWVVAGGDGTVTPQTSMTDDQGMARARWVLGPTAGDNSLSAEVTGIGRADFTATATRASSTTTITSHEPEPSAVGEPVTVEFTVTGSDAVVPTGDVTVSDGSASCTGSVATGSCRITVLHPGTHRLTATYSGDAHFSGSSDSEDHRVNGSGPNQRPIAAFQGPSCMPGVPCQFHDASFDSDGNIVSWTWSFGDGATSGDKDPSHTYGRPGTYTVKLTVRDASNAADDVTHRVTVSSSANQAPVANDDHYTTTSGTVLRVSGGSRSLIANDTDPDSDPLHTQPIDNAVTTSSGGSVTIGDDGSFEYTPPPAPFTGTDSFHYTLTDRPPPAEGLTATGTATITVSP